MARLQAIEDGAYLLADHLQDVIDALRLEIDEKLIRINERLREMGFPSWGFNGEV